MPQRQPAIKQAILFANPRSGRGKRWLWPILEQCRLQGIEITSSHFDLRVDYVRRVLEAAAEAGISTVLVAGGDGSVGTMAEHLIESEFTLGVVPAGTYNDFARSLGIPMNVAGAVRVVAQGLRAKVDAGRAGERIFAEAAVMGVNTDFARRAERLRGRIGRLSYLLAVLQAYRTRTRFAITLTINGEDAHFEAFEVAFVNAPVYGGPLDLALGKADLTSGELRVVVVKDLTWKTLLRALPRSFMHQELQVPGIEAFSIRLAHVRTTTPIAVTLDGEIAACTPLTITALPSALSVFVPASFLSPSHASALQR